MRRQLSRMLAAFILIIIPIKDDGLNGDAEIARHENARNAIVWNTPCCICLSIAEQECMSRQERAPDFAVNCVFVNDYHPISNSCLAFSGPAFLTVPCFHVSHFQSPRLNIGHVCVKYMLSLCDSLCKYAILSRLILYGQQIHTRSSSCYSRWRAPRAMSVRILCYAASIYTYCY